MSVYTYARYIGRLAFVLVSGLFHHFGGRNCVVGLTDREKMVVVGLKKIKERSKE